MAVRAIEKSMMQGGPLVHNGEIPDYGGVREFWTVAMRCIMSSSAQWVETSKHERATRKWQQAKQGESFACAIFLSRDLVSGIILLRKSVDFTGFCWNKLDVFRC